MLGPRIKVEKLHVVSADTPAELCDLVNEKLPKLELQGLPQFCEKCNKWNQFLVETMLVIPKELAEQMGGPRIMPIQGSLPKS